MNRSLCARRWLHTARLVLAAALAGTLGLAPGHALAAAGDLDPSFNGDGQVITHIGKKDRAYGVALQPDGKIVVGGRIAQGGSADFAVARYNPDGSLDTGFGNGGVALTDFGSKAFDEGYDVAIAPDGKIVLVGQSRDRAKNRFAVARYNPNGTPDTGFGTGGFTTVEFAPNAGGRGVAIQPDGKIVLAGATGDFQFALARINANGSPDASFSGGTVTTSFPGKQAEGEDVILQPDGKILVVGSVQGEFSVARYNPDGSLDSSFGSGGTSTVPVGGGGEARDIVLQPAGNSFKIVIGGNSRRQFTLVRFNANGTLDSGFGDGGVTQMEVEGGLTGNALAVQSDGKLVLAGRTNNRNNLALARFNANGGRDASFGDNGLVTLDTSGEEQFHDVVIQPDGKIVAVGTTRQRGTLRDFIVARFLAS